MSQRDRTGRGYHAASPAYLRPRIAFRNVLVCYTVARQNSDYFGTA
jgi:hypothetical protein